MHAAVSHLSTRASCLAIRKTGEIDKIDGPYYFFRALKKLRQALPQWMPVIGIEGGRVNMVPVDYVVDAMDHIAHKPGLDGGCFHLTDPAPRRIGEVLNIFARAGHAPEMTMRLDARMFALHSVDGEAGAGRLAAGQALHQCRAARPRHSRRRDQDDQLSDALRFARSRARAARARKIRVPDLQTYAWRLWDYWERHLDPDLFVDHSLSGKVKGRTVLITGGSSGIGKAAALKIAAAGAQGADLRARRRRTRCRDARKSSTPAAICHTYVADLAELKVLRRTRAEGARRAQAASIS